MTAILTKASIASIRANPYNAASASLAVIAVALLLVLLILKELQGALGTPESKVWLKTLNTAIVPMSLTFGFIVLVRFVALLLF